MGEGVGYHGMESIIFDVESFKGEVFDEEFFGDSFQSP